jgi:hypothetical protein
MSFLGHSQCPRCAERGNDRKKNNLAEYSDGWHCFSCGYRKPKKALSNLKRLEEFSEPRLCDGITLEKKLPIDALKWLAGYNLTLQEMRGFSYAGKRVIKGQEVPCSLLVLVHNGSYWLARNLHTDGVRYYSSGSKPLLKYGNNSHVIVLVEDVISAIKVARLATAIPMLSSKLPADWINHLKPYDKVIIWGDRDKAVQNTRESRRLSEILGKPVQNVITEKDPKYHETAQIKQLLGIGNDYTN